MAHWFVSLTSHLFISTLGNRLLLHYKKQFSGRIGQIIRDEQDKKCYEPSRAERPPSRAESEPNPSRAQLGSITRKYT